MTPDSRLNTTFGAYRIEELLGRGGMGVVYRAEHLSLGRKVALKLLAPELAENSSVRERFVGESRSAAAIDHPHIIPIYEAGEIDGEFFIAMRYVEGQDLGKEIARHGALEPQRALALIGQVAGALDAAHARGLVHRDVKPGNILLVAGSDHCYLTDFGLTKNTASASGATAIGQFVGTISYVAPEQIEGKALDRRTDVYSLACVLFEVLTGSAPYTKDTQVAVMWAHAREEPPRPSERCPGLPQGLDGVIATGMAKAPEHRFPTCTALVAAARAQFESSFSPRPAVSREATVAGVVGPPPAALRAQGTPDATRVDEWSPGRDATVEVGEPSPTRPRRPVMAIALVVAAVVLGLAVAGAALIATRDESSNGEAPRPDVRPVREDQPDERPAPKGRRPRLTDAEATADIKAFYGAVAAGDWDTAWVSQSERYRQKKRLDTDNGKSYADGTLDSAPDQWKDDYSTQDDGAVGVNSVQVTVDQLTRGGREALVTASGFDWNGDSCFDGKSWFILEGGEWRYDPGYKFWPDREREYEDSVALLGPDSDKPPC